MAEPRLAIRREVSVVPEDILWTLPFLELDQEALAAHIYPQRKPLFLSLKIFLFQISVRERRQAEIKENLTQLRAAKPAATMSFLFSGRRRGVKRTDDTFVVQHRSAPVVRQRRLIASSYPAYVSAALSTRR